MTNSKNTKRALLASVLSMMLCLAMLIGSTFAWFTDSVTSGKNYIVAGNLDVELNWSTDGSTWERVNEDTDMFKDTLWEPGYTRVVYLQVENAGSLALKYQFGINVASKVIGKTADDEDIDLSNFIKFGVVENAEYTADDAGRTAAREAVKDSAVLVSAGYASDEGHLSAKAKSDTIALVVYMPEEVGNDANHGFEKAVPSIDLGINLVATQYTAESDSFGDQYDKDAKYPEVESVSTKWFDDAATDTTTYELSTAADLAGLAQLVNGGESFAGKIITLANDIALDGVSNWVPIGTELNTFNGTFDGKNKTVSNLFYDQSKSENINAAGFFGVIGNATIKNLTVEGKIVARVTDDNIYSCGGIGGLSSGSVVIENCKNRVSIDCTDVSETTEGGVMAGGIIGNAMGSSGVNTKISDCINDADIVVGKEGINTNCYAGGITALIGYEDDGTVNNCQNNKSVSSKGNNAKSASIALTMADIMSF